jgi:hypothetical protein
VTEWNGAGGGRPARQSGGMAQAPESVTNRPAAAALAIPARRRVGRPMMSSRSLSREESGRRQSIKLICRASGQRCCDPLARVYLAMRASGAGSLQGLPSSDWPPLGPAKWARSRFTRSSRQAGCNLRLTRRRATPNGHNEHSSRKGNLLFGFGGGERRKLV